jgi:hypothetical protein
MVVAKEKKQLIGPNRDLNPGPPAPKAGIIPLDHLAAVNVQSLPCGLPVTIELYPPSKMSHLAAVGFEPTPSKGLVP